MLPSFHISSRGVAFSVLSVFLALDIVAVAARIYVRRALKQRMNADDWLVLPALVRESFEITRHFKLTESKIMIIGMVTATFVGAGEGFLYTNSPNMIPGGPLPLADNFWQAYAVAKKVT